MNPNSDQVTASAVTIVAAGLAYAAGQGWVDGTQVGALAVAIVTLIGVGIHFIVNTQLNKVKKAAAIVNISVPEQAKAGITDPIKPPPPPTT